jgi:hypothetical protein
MSTMKRAKVLLSQHQCPKSTVYIYGIVVYARLLCHVLCMPYVRYRRYVTSPLHQGLGLCQGDINIYVKCYKYNLEDGERAPHLSSSVISPSF